MFAPLVLASNEEYLPPVVPITVGFDVNTEITRLSKQYLIDEDLVKRIIKCESGFVKDALNINKRDGVAWSKDIGLGQINDYYHKETMIKLGLDIYTPKDNLAYMFILLKEDPLVHYKASSGCWSLDK